MFDETMETEVPLEKMPIAAARPETGFAYQNFLPFLHEGKNRLSAFVGLGEYSPVTMRMVLYTEEY